MSAAAVVIGLDSSAATGLQTARILARRGIRVIGVAADRRHPCCRTRVCSEIVEAPTEGAGLTASLMELGMRLGERAVLFPCSDLAVLTISRARAVLASRFHVVLPPGPILEMLLDKAHFADWASAAGLPIPKTYVLRTRADLTAVAREIAFPCMLKPAVKTAEWRQHVGVKLFEIADAAELFRRYEQCSLFADSLIVQERVEGGDTDHFTCNGYFNAESQALAVFTSRKLRQWPPHGGEGCLSEAVSDERTKELAVRLFTIAEHRGLGYVEIKRDARTGAYLILEANVGRPTGRSAQAEANGVELLHSMYCDALGSRPPRSSQPRRAAKWIYLRRDVRSALYHWRRGELTLAEWRRSWRGVRSEALFSWRDPLPFCADLGRTVVRSVRHARA